MEKPLKPEKMHINASPIIYEYARLLRDKLTEAEAILWEAIRNKKLEGHKFRRQHPFGKFILDFYCHKKLLAIELDGEYHLGKEQRAYDEMRTKGLMEFGIKELRFKNSAVIENLDDVLQKILVELNN